MFEQPTVSLGLAFLAGVLSFLSPCILPVLPSFLGYMSGISLSPAALRLAKPALRRRLLFNSILFSLGFLFLFVVVGASIGFLGQFFLIHQRFFQIVGGLIILMLGLHMLGLLNFSFLHKEYKFKPPAALNHVGEGVRSFCVGILFSFGWAPCYGPITGTILTLIAVKGSAAIGFWLFAWYSLGFIVPFLLISLFITTAVDFLKKHTRALRMLNRLAGVLVMLLGILLITNFFSDLVPFLTPYYNRLDFSEFG